MSYKRISPQPVIEGGTGASTLTGVLTGNGTSAITANAVTQYGTVIAGASNAVSSVAPSATSGVPYISQGAASNPTFGTAVVAGGGTGIVTTTAYAPICGGTTATGAFQAASTGIGTAGFVLTSNGAAALPSFQAATGAVSSVTGTANQITSSPTTGAVVVSLPSAITAPGSLTTTTTLAGGTSVTAGTNFLLPTTSSTAGQLQINSDRYLHAYGTNNFFAGYQAGNFTLTATHNTCVGRLAGNGLSSQGFNTIVGSEAGYQISSGNQNTIMGKGCASNMTTGHHNIILGTSNTSQTSAGLASNIIIAESPGANPTVADNRIVIGQQGTGDGQQNKCYIAGIYNTAIGATAGVVLVDNTSGAGRLGGLNGSANTFFVGGTSPSFSASPTASGTITGNALSSTTTVTAGTDLVSTAGNLKLPTTSSTVGQLQINSTRFLHAYGTNSTFVGASAGNFTLSGASNSCIGNGSGGALTTGTENAGLGVNALRSVQDGGRNCAIGAGCLDAVTSGSYNSAIGKQAIYQITSGSYNCALGYNAGGSYTSSEGSNIIIGYNNTGTAAESNVLRIGSATGTGNGQLNSAVICGINGKTSSSGIAVYVNASDVLGTSTSSERFKTNITSIPLSDSIVQKLRPVSFNYKDEILESRNEENVKQYGFIAEEVAAIDPELVAYDKSGFPYAVRTQFFIPMLVAEIQRLTKQVAWLTDTIKEKDC